MVVRKSHDCLSPDSGTPYRPPEVSSTTFAVHPPNLQLRFLIPMYRDGICCLLPARPAGTASYSVSVRQVTVLLGASFGHGLTSVPLRSANTSPPSGCVEDLHLQVAKHARHTNIGACTWRAGPNTKSNHPTLRIIPKARAAGKATFS